MSTRLRDELARSGNNGPDSGSSLIDSEIVIVDDDGTEQPYDPEAL
ncbi:hypothetical protein QBC98_000397 [Kitasatospora acidiphila]